MTCYWENHRTAVTLTSASWGGAYLEGVALPSPGTLVRVTPAGHTDGLGSRTSTFSALVRRWEEHPDAPGGPVQGIGVMWVRQQDAQTASDLQHFVSRLHEDSSDQPRSSSPIRSRVAVAVATRPMPPSDAPERPRQSTGLPVAARPPRQGASAGSATSDERRLQPMESLRGLPLEELIRRMELSPPQRDEEDA